MINACKIASVPGTPMAVRTRQLRAEPDKRLGGGNMLTTKAVFLLPRQHLAGKVRAGQGEARMVGPENQIFLAGIPRD